MNFLISLAGWFAWNVMILRIDKDAYDTTGKTFPISEYASKTWDNWLASLAMIPILLFIGYRQMNLDPMAVIDVQHLKWSDLYYLGSGFFTEAVMYAYKKWKNQKEKVA